MCRERENTRTLYFHVTCFRDLCNLRALHMLKDILHFSLLEAFAINI